MIPVTLTINGESYLLNISDTTRIGDLKLDLPVVVIVFPYLVEKVSGLL